MSVLIRGLSVEFDQIFVAVRGLTVEFNLLSPIARGVTVEYTDIIKYHERAIDYVDAVSIPVQEDVDRGFKECCYNNIVLADLLSSDSDKNDFTSVFFKRQSSSDTCDFVLVDSATLTEYSLNDSIYGDFVDFDGYDNQQDLKTYKVEWKKVLTLLGEGVYYIRKDTIIAGIATPIKTNTFTLKKYSIVNADHTIRIDSVFNGELVKTSVDFSGTDYTTSLRTSGYFGDREVTFTQDNIVRIDYYTEQISIASDNEYNLQTGFIPYCITSELFDFMLLADELYITDYNSTNHSYKYKIHPVQLSENAGTRYFARARKAEVNLKFKDRIVNNRKINC